MANYKLKDLRGPQRRNFLRLMAAAGAGFALERSRLLNFIADEGGTALAAEACGETNRHVGIVSGGGNFCLWQLIWPLPDVAASLNPAFAYDAVGQGFMTNYVDENSYFKSGAADRPMYYGPDAPFVDQASQTVHRPMSAYLVADTAVHHRKPLRQITIDGALPGNTNNSGDGIVGNSVTLFAAIGALQRTTTSILPSIGVAPASIGSAPGAPTLSVVPSADSMVDLFNSAASKAILLAQEDKSMFETYYKAILGLREAAGRPTWARELDIAKKASNLIGRNLADQLRPETEDLDFYGASAVQAMAASEFFGGQNGKDRLLNLAKSLIITKKAFALGLTNQVIIGVVAETGGGIFTDPHETFAQLPGARNVIKYYGMFLDRFYQDLGKSADPACTAKSLDKTVITTVHGDHPHDPLTRNAWPDSTPGGANWLYVMGNGYLPAGWHGHPKTNNTAMGIDPTTGLSTAYNGMKSVHAASAAVLYAIANGDMKKVTEFYKGSAITALVNKV